MRGALLTIALAGCTSGAPVSAAPVDAGGETVTTCAGACRTQSLEAQFGATRATFERTVYGLTSPTKSASKQWELHVEAVAGGDPGCPTSASATPERTLVIAGLLQTFSAPRGYVDGVRATLLDFRATLTKEPILRATEVTATPRASGDDYVAFDLDATFPGGRISGHLYATHCATMDDL